MRMSYHNLVDPFRERILTLPLTVLINNNNNNDDDNNIIKPKVSRDKFVIVVLEAHICSGCP